ncbi:MAG TPA: Smr/MutS family protein [Gammaproteobacteria bacterium]|nr:Smr/MutS family protein [Gammaproteobacteria bacterium]
MKKKPDNSEEKELFRAWLRGVKPLTHTKVETQKNPLSSPRRQAVIQEPPSADLLFSDYEKFESVKSEDFLEFARPGLQHKVLRKMRQGQYNPEGILDLHGKTVTEARESLSTFLLQCEKKGLRHILIIHGKGRQGDTPVLKNKLNNWLRQIEQVIAFCTAIPKNGGSGAVYVLLRAKH